ncbi:hypothetical protein KM043_010626 [Ampulex compressa]|nr:hypothetical protein KM043_010626 [Ampulex compressa]
MTLEKTRPYLHRLAKTEKRVGQGPKVPGGWRRSELRKEEWWRGGCKRVRRSRRKAGGRASKLGGENIGRVSFGHDECEELKDANRKQTSATLSAVDFGYCCDGGLRYRGLADEDERNIRAGGMVVKSECRGREGGWQGGKTEDSVGGGGGGRRGMNEQRWRIIEGEGERARRRTRREEGLGKARGEEEQVAGGERKRGRVGGGGSGEERRRRRRRRRQRQRPEAEAEAEKEGKRERRCRCRRGFAYGRVNCAYQSRVQGTSAGTQEEAKTGHSPRSGGFR